MENKKILNLLNEAGDSKFVTRNWNIFNVQSNANYDVEIEIIYNPEVLKSNLCNYNNDYEHNSVKRYNALRYYLSKVIIKNYNVIINLKNFYDQPTDSDIKPYG